MEVQNETLENKIAVVEVFLTRMAAMRSRLPGSRKIQINPNTTETAHLKLTVENPCLWDIDTPGALQAACQVTDVGILRLILYLQIKLLPMKLPYYLASKP